MIGRKGFIRLCLGATAVTLAVLLMLLVGLWQDWTAARNELVREQFRVSEDASAAIAKIIGEVESVAHATGREIAHIETPTADMGAVIEQMVARHPDIAMIGVAFEPFAFDPHYRLAAPLVRRLPGGGFGHERIESAYDYTAPTVTWYREALKRGQVWDHPQSDRSSGENFVNFSLRIQLADGRMAVVRVSYPLSKIAAVVTHLDLGHHGYGLLRGADGRLLVSPGLSDRSTDQGSGAIEEGDSFRSSLTGHDSRTVTRQIKGPDWTLLTVHSWRDLKLNFTDRHQRILLATLFAVLLPVGLGAAHIAWAGSRGLYLSWLWSTAVAISFALGITTIWALALEGEGTLKTTGDVIASRGALDGFERRVLRQSLIEGRQLPSFVPTGVFVQSVEFLSANNLLLTGYVWQRYAKDMPHARGVILPEAEESEMTEVLRQDHGRDEVIVWRLKATLRQSFSYVRFPFDRESIWLRLWPADLERPMVLVPDFSSYSMTNPSALPGVERTLFISGWTAASSFFEYRHNGYNSSFGVDASMGDGGRQELYFNVEIVRNFLDPFVSHITPILLVLLLIFAMQMTVTRHAEQKDLLGFNAATIITTCAALFFAVLISHIEVRGALSAKKIFYGEYFYLVTYAVILAACVNAILFTYDSSLRWVQYRDNLLAKILYWPVVMAAMYLVTLVTFY